MSVGKEYGFGRRKALTADRCLEWHMIISGHKDHVTVTLNWKS